MVSFNAAKSIVRNSLNKVARNQKAAQISKQTLDNAMKEIITEDATSNTNKLSQGLLKQTRKEYIGTKASEGLSKRTNISNFGNLGSQTKKLKEVRQNKQIQEGRKQYNK